MMAECKCGTVWIQVATHGADGSHSCTPCLLDKITELKAANAELVEALQDVVNLSNGDCHMMHSDRCDSIRIFAGPIIEKHGASQ